jgi:tape measure domain-containing protein
MTTAGQIDVKLGLNSEEFIKGVSQADDKLKKLGKSLGGLGGDITTKANPAVEALSGALKKLAGPAIAIAVSKKLIELGKQAVNTAAKFESLAVSFEVLTGGAEAGQRLTNQIIELAAKTPLTTEALTSGARTLLSFGESADEVVNDLKLLGDITGGDAQKMQSLTLAFAQVGSTGRLAGQDLLQMINAGFNPLETMAQKTKKSMGQLKKEMSEGKITFNDVKQAMIDATSEGGRFNGMMEKQSQTLEGLKATNQDTWEQVSKAIGDFFLPAAKAVQKAFIKIGKSALDAIKKIRKFTEDLRFQSADSQLQLSKGLAKQADELLKVADGYEKRGNKVWAETYRKKAAQYDAESKRMLAKYEETLKKEEEISKKHTSIGGFSAMSGKGTTEDKEALKKAKKQKEDLLNISKDYARQIADIESYETAKAELAGEGGKFQRNYTEKLQILQWYYNERYRIMEAANNNMSLAQEQFNQLEELKNQKMAQANISTWAEYGNSLKSILSGSFTTLLTTSGDFGDTMMSLMSSIYQSLLKLALDAAIKEINIATWKTAILTALNAFTGGIGGTVAGAVTGATPSIASLDTFHSGGLSTQEQLAVIRKDERVLNPAETSSYNSGQGGTSESGINNIMMFNIKAWDGKDVINTLKSNSQTINQIVASGIKNNNQGLRTTVQNI